MARSRPQARRVEKSPLLSNQRIAMRSSRRASRVGPWLREMVAIALGLLQMLVGLGLKLLGFLVGVARKIPGWLVVGTTAALFGLTTLTKTVYHLVVEWCTFAPSHAPDPGARREPQLADDFSASVPHRVDDSNRDDLASWDQDLPDRQERLVEKNDLESWLDESGPWSTALEKSLTPPRGWDEETMPLKDTDFTRAFETAKMASLDDEEKSLPEDELHDQAAALRGLSRQERWRS